MKLYHYQPQSAHPVAFLKILGEKQSFNRKEVHLINKAVLWIVLTTMVASWIKPSLRVLREAGMRNKMLFAYFKLNALLWTVEFFAQLSCTACFLSWTIELEVLNRSHSSNCWQETNSVL